MIIFGFILLTIGMYLLFICSEKQRSKKTTHRLKSILQKHFRVARIGSFVLFILCAFLLIQKYGFSIGFVSWWIFATPLTFLLILWINPLTANKPQQK